MIHQFHRRRHHYICRCPQVLSAPPVSSCTICPSATAPAKSRWAVLLQRARRTYPLPPAPRSGVLLVSSFGFAMSSFPRTPPLADCASPGLGRVSRCRPFVENPKPERENQGETPNPTQILPGLLSVAKLFRNSFLVVLKATNNATSKAIDSKNSFKRPSIQKN